MRLFTHYSPLPFSLSHVMDDSFPSGCSVRFHEIIVTNKRDRGMVGEGRDHPGRSIVSTLCRSLTFLSFYKLSARYNLLRVVSWMLVRTARSLSGLLSPLYPSIPSIPTHSLPPPLSLIPVLERTLRYIFLHPDIFSNVYKFASLPKSGRVTSWPRQEKKDGKVSRCVSLIQGRKLGASALTSWVMPMYPPPSSPSISHSAHFL